MADIAITPTLTQMTHDNLKPMITSILSALCRRTPAFTLIYEYVGDPALYIGGVMPEDEGRLIGKKGKTFWALTVIHYYACRLNNLPQVRIHEIETSPTRSTNVVAFLQREDWDREAVTEMIEQILQVLDPGAAWVLDESNGAVAMIRLSANLQNVVADPSLVTALDILIHAAGKSCGANIKTEVSWA